MNNKVFDEDLKLAHLAARFAEEKFEGRLSVNLDPAAPTPPFVCPAAFPFHTYSLHKSTEFSYFTPSILISTCHLTHEPSTCPPHPQFSARI